MASTKIKSGSNLGSLAKEYGTTVDALLQLNQGNPSVKSRDLIIAGGDLNIPDAPTNPSPQTSNTPNTDPATAMPPSILADAGFSSSFMGDMRKGIEEATKGMAEAFPKPSEGGVDSPEYKAHEARKSNIGSDFGRARDEVDELKREGEFNRDRARELLGMTPAAIRHNIDNFIIQSDKFDSTVARSIERLTQEEQAALANEDYNYAKELRQQKVDYYNFQRQALTDKFTFMTTAFNLLLTGKNYDRQVKVDTQTEASNRLNTILQGAEGKKFDTLSPELQAQLAKDAEVLGLPMQSIRQIIETPKAAFHVANDNGVFIFDKSGNLIKSMGFPGGGPNGGGPGTPSGLYLKSLLDGDINGVQSVPEKHRLGVQSQLEEIKADALGSLTWNERMNAGTTDATMSAEDAQKGIVERVSQEVTRSKALVEELTGQKGILTREETKRRVVPVIEKYVETLVPKPYIIKERARAKNPFMNLVGG